MREGWGLSVGHQRGPQLGRCHGRLVMVQPAAQLPDDRQTMLTLELSALLAPVDGSMGGCK
jgi:hypothetical protein